MKLNLQQLTLKKKLVTAFVLVAVIPTLIISVLSLNRAQSSLEAQAYRQLEAVREIKKAQINQFFNNSQADLEVLVETTGTIRQEAMNKLVAVRDNKKIA
jgi:methyl-accepting chemotaxis protein